MKIRNLFLASLAALAIFSCSNEELTENKDTAKDAVLNFSIAFPAITKATDPGIAVESKVNNITLVLTYTGGTPTFTKTYPVSAFTVTNNTYTLVDKEMVAPGEAAVTVYVNNSGVPADSILESTGVFDLGTYADITGEGNFFMSGESNVSIKANVNTNQASVNVDRVAAKLREMTPDNSFSPTATALSGATETTVISSLNITLTDYTFSNLNQKSYALASGGMYYKSADFWNPFMPDNVDEDTWDATFGNNTKEMMTDTVTYCFENNTAENGSPTRIYYKATATIDGVTAGTNFYVYDNKVYKDFNELNSMVFNSSLTTAFGLTDASPNSDFMTKVAVRKYTGGICYYGADIVANTSDNILRNNYYQIRVTSIADLGLPEIDTPPVGDPTLLGLDVTVNDWTVHVNEISL